MAKKNRPSVLKRIREAEKRQRNARRAEKAAQKRERRALKASGMLEDSPDEDVQEGTDSLSLPTDPTEVGNDAPASSSA